MQAFGRLTTNRWHYQTIAAWEKEKHFHAWVCSYVNMFMGPQSRSPPAVDRCPDRPEIVSEYMSVYRNNRWEVRADWGPPSSAVGGRWIIRSNFGSRSSCLDFPTLPP